MSNKDKNRCAWSGADQLMIQYHDEEWGVPEHDENRLFEFLILEGAQAGLSWSAILNRREAYRNAFLNFDVQKVAKFTASDQENLLQTGIIRNKLKIKSAITNAQNFLLVQNEFGSFDTYLWDFVSNQPIRNAFTAMTDIPTMTELSKTLSKALKKRGFNFVGPTICYAYMQSMGMVNDHLTNCFRYKEIINSI